MSLKMSDPSQVSELCKTAITDTLNMFGQEKSKSNHACSWMAQLGIQDYLRWQLENILLSHPSIFITRRATVAQL